MAWHLSAEIYEIFEGTFKGKDQAKKVLFAIEEAIENSVHDTWYRTREELKTEVFSEFATKRDLDKVRIELIGKFDTLYEKTEKDKSELLLKLEQTNKKFSIYCITLLFAIIFLNQNALEFIEKVIGLVK